MGQYNYAYKCRECGTELGLKMRANNPTKKPKPTCPNCGSQDTDEDDVSADDERRQRRHARGEKKSSGVLIGIAAVAIILCGGFALAALVRYLSPVGVASAPRQEVAPDRPVVPPSEEPPR
jgi:DNA-directed RNA polymerase subunit RPC12/RpoP